MDLLSATNSSKSTSSNTPVNSDVSVSETTEEVVVEDNAPLFYTPGKRGFCSPRQGRATFERINAFRNTGRYVIDFFFFCCILLTLGYVFCHLTIIGQNKKC